MTDRQCRICGCTDITACQHDDGTPCAWVDDDLCSVCHDAEIASVQRDAARYRHLRNRRTTQADIDEGGVFAGRTADNTILGGEHLDRAIDAELGLDAPEVAPLETRLADCLAACVDTPLIEGRDELGGHSSPLQLRLGFFKPELSNRAAELLDEAGR